MAQAKLWSGPAIVRVLMMGLFVALLTACLADDKPVGMTLLFQSAGWPVGVRRFDPDGMRGPVPGSVGSMSPRGGAEMSFMPGDSKRGIPKFVDVEWTVVNPALDAWWKENISNRADKHSPKWNKDYQEAMSQVPRYVRRVDLTPIITPELIEQVRENSQTTQLKLIITFKNDDIDIKAMAYQWRNSAPKQKEAFY